MSEYVDAAARSVERAQDAIGAADVIIRAVTGTLREAQAAHLEMRLRVRAIRAARWCRWTQPDGQQLGEWAKALEAKRRDLRKEYRRLSAAGDKIATADFTLRLRAHAAEIEDFEAVVEFALLDRLDRNWQAISAPAGAS